MVDIVNQTIHRDVTLTKVMSTAAIPQSKENYASTRLSPETFERLKQVARAESQKMGFKVRVCHVLEMCVTGQLPLLERRLGVAAPEPAKPEEVPA